MRLLCPLDAGGKLRTANILKQLKKRNHITLVALRYQGDDDKAVIDTQSYCDRLITISFQETSKGTISFYNEIFRNLMDDKPYVIAKYSSSELRLSVQSIIDNEKPDLVICDFPHSYEALPNQTIIPFLLFQHNVEADILSQLAENANNYIVKSYFRIQSKRMARYEGEICRKASHIIAVSEHDKIIYSKRYHADHCDIIATGVDIDYFYPSKNSGDSNKLVFTGSMDWLANQDAIRFFHSDIFPKIRQNIPGIELTVVGRNPPKDILQLRNQNGIHITGRVPDVRPYIADAGIFIVPLRIGSGTRMKILEAMSMGKAIISTSLGAEGIPVAHGQDIILSDTPDDFAKQIIRLSKDKALRQMLGKNAREKAVKDHSWEQIGGVFEEICIRTARKIKEANK